MGANQNFWIYHIKWRGGNQTNACTETEVTALSPVYFTILMYAYLLHALTRPYLKLGVIIQKFKAENNSI